MSRRDDQPISKGSFTKKMLIWLPSVVGFALLPASLLGVRLATGGFSPQDGEVREIASVMVGAAINTIPFALSSVLAKQDIAGDLHFFKRC